MSLEETSPDLAAMLPVLPANVLAGLRGVSSPDVMYHAKQHEHGGAAEAAVAYLQDAPAEQKPVLALVKDHEHRDESLEAARANAIDDLQRQIDQLRQNNDLTGAQKLENVLIAVSAATSKQGIAAAIATAQAAAGQSADKPETPADKLERLNAQYKKLEEDVSEQMRKAHERGDITDEAYKKYMDAQRRAEESVPGPQQNAAREQANKIAEQSLGNAAQTAADNGQPNHALEYQISANNAHKAGEIVREMAAQKSPVQTTPSVNSTVPVSPSVASRNATLYAEAVAPKQHVETVNFNGFDMNDANQSIAQEAKAAVSPTLKTHFGGDNDVQGAQLAQAQTIPNLKIRDNVAIGQG